VKAFLRRALAIEVVRRSFDTDEDIIPAQELHFAQLTPLATARIFSARPFSRPGPEGGERKLTGIRLGHFAAFYRRSWRANDFMWGRLDAAVRVVDMLIDAPRARKLADEQGQQPWQLLAELVVPDEDDAFAEEQRQLVHEVLADAKAPQPRSNAPPPVADVVALLADYPGAPGPPPTPELRRWTSDAIKADLRHEDGGLFTRVVCTRAAQLEILAHELPHLVDESKGDWKLGCFVRPLPLDLRNGLHSAIAQIREWQASDKKQDWLPNQLGRDSGDESASRLALRTIVRTLFVAIGALQTAKIPLSSLLKGVRPPLLPVAGIASRGLLDRVCAVLGLSAAGIFVTARLLQTQDKDVPFGALWSPPVLLTWIAALGILGGVLVPSVRAYRAASKTRKAVQSAWAAALFFGGGAIAVILAASIGGLGLAQLLTNPGAGEPHDAVIWFALGALLTGVPILRIAGLPATLTNFLDRRLHSAPSSVVTAAAALATCWWSLHVLVPALNDGNWKALAGWVTVAYCGVCAVYVLIATRR
jgi:hypothetical protein